MIRLYVTGAAGLLGSEVVASARRRGYDVRPLTRAELDVTDREAARGVLAGDGGQAGGPSVVVQCAAYTAVDRAESEPELAARVNRDGAANVAAAAAEAGAWLVHVSTDYVFDGPRSTPWRTDDEPAAPRSVYGQTKLAGERAALASSPTALVVRTGWLYGAAGRNFVTAMLERGRLGDASAGEPLRVVDDQRGRPTWARNTAEGMLDLLEHRARGVWHVADGGEATWLDLARETFDLCGVDTPLGPVSTEAWGAPAPRPPYSVLDLAGTEALLGRPSMPWREALRRFLTETGDIEER